jgi:MFS family permease
MEAGGLDAARHANGHDHGQSCRSETRAQNTAILADLGGPVSQRFRGYWDHRRGMPMLQGTFGGTLFRDPSIGFTQFSDAQKTLTAEIGGGFIGLFSLFNIGGRFFWATLSDSIGRKTTYFVFFVLGVVCYAVASALAGMKAVVVFAAAFCIVAAMYGGGFATVPAYLADIFGARFVGAIHGLCSPRGRQRGS